MTSDMTNDWIRLLVIWWPVFRPDLTFVVGWALHMKYWSTGVQPERPHPSRPDTLCCTSFSARHALLYILLGQTRSAVHPSRSDTLCCTSFSATLLLYILLGQTRSAVHPSRPDTLCCTSFPARHSLLYILPGQTRSAVHPSQSQTPSATQLLFSRQSTWLNPQWLTGLNTPTK